MNKEDLARMLGNRDPRWDVCRRQRAEQLRAGDKPVGKTISARIEELERIVSCLLLGREAIDVMAQIEASSRNLLANEYTASILGAVPAELSKLLLAMDAKELERIAAMLKVEQVAEITVKARSAVLAAIPSRAPELVFDLLPLEQLEHVRATTLHPGQPPTVALVPRDDAPEPSTSVFIEAVPPAISRATALASWRRDNTENEQARQARPDIPAWPLPSLPP